MATLTSPVQYSIIMADGSGQLDGNNYDRQTQPYSGNLDNWIINLISAQAFALYIRAAYAWYGSDHLRVRFYRYSMASNSWVQAFDYNYLNGNGTATMNIHVNCNCAATGAGVNYTLTYNDATHFCVSVCYLSYGAGWDWNGSSYNNFHIGDYSICSRYSLMKNTPIYGRVSSEAMGNTSVSLVRSYSQPTTDPFTTTWGNFTDSRGSIITANDKYKAASLYGYSV